MLKNRHQRKLKLTARGVEILCFWHRPRLRVIPVHKVGEHGRTSGHRVRDRGVQQPRVDVNTSHVESEITPHCVMHGFACVCKLCPSTSTETDIYTLKAKMFMLYKRVKIKVLLSEVGQQDFQVVLVVALHERDELTAVTKRSFKHCLQQAVRCYLYGNSVARHVTQRFLEQHRADEVVDVVVGR